MMKINPRNLKKTFGFLSWSPLHPQWLLRCFDGSGIREISGKIKGNVLDIGCGTKYLKGQIKPETRYIGMDYLHTAEEWYQTIPDVYADAKFIPFPDGSIDNIFLLDVLEHLPDPVSSLNKIKRVLVPGGVLVMQTPFLYPVHDAPLDFARWTEYGLEKLLRQAGFGITRIDRIGHPFVTAGIIINLAICKTVINSINRRYLSSLIAVLLLFLVPVINIFALILGVILPDDEFAPVRYRVIAENTSL